MRITAQQTSTRTIADLIRAADHKWAVTVTYLKPGETEPTIRTIEIATAASRLGNKALRAVSPQVSDIRCFRGRCYGDAPTQSTAWATS